MNRLSCSCLHLPPNVTCLDCTLSESFCQMKIKNPAFLDRRCTLSIVPTYAILEVILKMEIIMENKFVKKPTPKGDKTTKIVFIGLLAALLFVIAGTAIFFAVSGSSKATKGSASSSKSSTTVYSGSNAEDPLFKITLKTFGDNKEFLLVTPNPAHDRNMFNIVGVAGQYLITQEYKGELSDKKNAKGGRLYKYDYFNIYLYDTEEPNQKPKKIDILKLAKNAGDEDYLNEPTLKLLMFNNQSYLQMPFGASVADFTANKKYLNLQTQEIEEMNIQSNTNNLEMEFFYAHVDKAKTLEPFGLEMWKSGGYGKDDDSTTYSSPGGLPALYCIEENGRDLNMDNTNFAKEQKEVYEAVKTNHARIYTRPSKIDNETWLNTFLHWLAPEGEDAYELAVHSYSPTHEEGKVKSYQELQTWNDNHYRKNRES